MKITYADKRVRSKESYTLNEFTLADANEIKQVVNNLVDSLGSSSDVVLASPNGTLWKVGITNEGVISTSITTGETPGTLVLIAPNLSQWSVSVNNAGAIVTTIN